jgi:hypothetical protein
MKKKKPDTLWVPFVDNKGIVRLKLKGSSTIGELVRMFPGAKFGLVDKNLPIADGELTHNPEHYPRK